MLSLLPKDVVEAKGSRGNVHLLIVKLETLLLLSCNNFCNQIQEPRVSIVFCDNLDVIEVGGNGLDLDLPLVFAALVLFFLLLLAEDDIVEIVDWSDENVFDCWCDWK